MSSMPAHARSPGYLALQIVRYAICIFIALLVLVPLVVAVLGGFKTNAELVTSPFTLPDPIRLDNYTSVLNSPFFWTQLRNSTFVMAVTAIGDQYVL